MEGSKEESGPKVKLMQPTPQLKQERHITIPSAIKHHSHLSDQDHSSKGDRISPRPGLFHLNGNPA